MINLGTGLTATDVKKALEELSSISGSNFIIKQTIEDMIALESTLVTSVIVTEEGRGGIFNYDASRHEENDGGTVFNGWIRQYSNAIEVKWFGAKGDGIADDTQAIQLAIDCAIQTKQKEVYINKGVFRITDTIHLGYTGFNGVNLIGDGNNYKGEQTLGGTIIIAEFGDRPAIAVQGARLSRLSRFTLIGQNVANIEGNNLGAPSCAILDTDIEVWTKPGLSTGRYNPYAGIAIDPYSGARPTESYPDVNYPAWTGITEQYGKASSSQVRFDDVSLYGFHVGIVCQPCNYDGGGDFTTMDKVSLVYCAYGYSVGNSQARQMNISNSLINGCHTAFTTTTHGLQRGKCHGTFLNTNFDRIILVGDINPAYGSLKLNCCYGENMYQLFKLQSSSGNGALLLDNCELNLGAVMQGQRGVPKYFIEGSNNSVIFNGGSIRLPDNVVFTTDIASSITLNETKIPLIIKNRTTAKTIAWNFMQNGIAPFINNFKVNPLYRNYNIDTLDVRSDYAYNTVPVSQFLGRSVTFPSKLSMAQATYKEWKLKEKHSYINTATWDSLTYISNNEFTVDIHTSDVGRARYRVDLGDIIFKNDTFYYVTSREGTVIGLKAISNFAKDLTLNNPIVIPSSGDALHWHSRKYTLDGGNEYILSIAEGSSVANIKRYDGYLGSLENDFKVGDRLIIHDELYQLFAVGDAQKITEVDGAAGTITFEHTARRTISDVLVFMMSRTYNS